MYRITPAAIVNVEIIISLVYNLNNFTLLSGSSSKYLVTTSSYGISSTTPLNLFY